MILLIDNYDSFSYNLYQLVGELDSDILVIRNDELRLCDIEKLNPDKIIISPGPGRPIDAGICEDVIAHFAGKVPILGVCLGHQAICETFGANITYAKELMHGKQSVVTVDKECKLFKGLSDEIKVARYHSLAADSSELPSNLKVVAKADDGEVMAVKHKDYEVYGLQFHPESILTPDGKEMIRNFLVV
ncbi:anthranilate synthase, component II [Butyrivibrio fibrisolvens 16/4]|nr:anthranilate synthase, component II [Butyrivibrio fibrisolvens 16/4]